GSGKNLRVVAQQTHSENHPKNGEKRENALKILKSTMFQELRHFESRSTVPWVGDPRGDWGR
ncbi:MAG: hypothetical protein ACK5QX_04190, partial [bacterium]